MRDPNECGLNAAGDARVSWEGSICRADHKDLSQKHSCLWAKGYCWEGPLGSTNCSEEKGLIGVLGDDGSG